MSWTAVVLEIPLRLEEELVGAVADDSLGAEFAGRDAERGCLRIYVGSPESALKVIGRLETVLRDHGVDPTACDLSTEAVADEAWVERYQASLTPFEIGRRFHIDPTGEGGITGGGRIRIVIVPGRAFGTGEHPTTRLGVEALERHVREGRGWLDLGCGSGILAIVAHHCGARPVRALDVDPEAVDVARRTLSANRLHEAIALREGSVETLHAGSCDGVVANIASEYFIASGCSIAALLRPGGILIATGFYATEAAEIDRTFHARGLRTIDRVFSEGWALRGYRSPGAD